MDFGALSGHGYLLIGGLILIGAGLLIISLIVNLRVAHSVRHDARHREKLLEYYRNTFSQLGVILIGIGVSLFIFFFQQNYQDRRKRETEIQQVLAKMALRIARGSAVMESLSEFDALLDDGGPYKNPEEGGANRAISVRGTELAAQVAKILLVERDVDVKAFEVMNLSRDFESSFVVNELNSALWFNIVKDESDIEYATTQLPLDYKDLHDAIGDESLAVAVANPEKEQKIKQEVLDIFYDADLLRQRSRRLLGRACWLFSNGPGFVALGPIDEIEASATSHQEWLERSKPFLTHLVSGSGDCFKLLHYSPGPSLDE
jgi:hypothetical protein